jgi:hypothetical protein
MRIQRAHGTLDETPNSAAKAHGPGNDQALPVAGYLPVARAPPCSHDSSDELRRLERPRVFLEIRISFRPNARRRHPDHSVHDIGYVLGRLEVHDIPGPNLFHTVGLDLKQVRHTQSRVHALARVDDSQSAVHRD